MNNQDFMRDFQESGVRFLAHKIGLELCKCEAVDERMRPYHLTVINDDDIYLEDGSYIHAGSLVCGGALKPVENWLVAELDRVVAATLKGRREEMAQR